MTRGAVARRMVFRTGVQVRRHKLQWVAACVAVFGVGVAFQVCESVSAGPATDCADQVMHLLVDLSIESARTAYPCLGTTYRQVLSEDAFVVQAQSDSPPASTRMTRTGEERSATGGKVVSYVLERAGQRIPYAVHLGEDGRVERVE